MPDKASIHVATKQVKTPQAKACCGVSEKVEVLLRICPQSELGLFLRWRVECFAIAKETPVGCFGYSVAEFIAELRTVCLALLAQRLQPFGIGYERFDGFG